MSKKSVLQQNKNRHEFEYGAKTMYSIVEVREGGENHSYHIEGTSRRNAELNAQDFISLNGLKNATITGTHVMQ